MCREQCSAVHAHSHRWDSSFAFVCVFWQIPAVAVVNDAGVLTGYVSDDTAKLIGTECTAGVENVAWVLNI